VTAGFAFATLSHKCMSVQEILLALLNVAFIPYIAKKLHHDINSRATECMNIKQRELYISISCN